LMLSGSNVAATHPAAGERRRHAYFLGNYSSNKHRSYHPLKREYKRM